MLIIGNPQATILHIPTGNNGIMECCNREIITFYAVICQGRKLAAKPVAPTISAVGVYLPEGRHPIIPFFHHSIIPIAERSGAKFFYLLPESMISKFGCIKIQNVIRLSMRRLKCIL
jgi:hypothetical protein